MDRQIAGSSPACGGSRSWSRTSRAPTRSSPPTPWRRAHQTATPRLLTADETFPINPHLYAKLPFDTQRDLSIDGTKAQLTEQPFSAVPLSRGIGPRKRPVLAAPPPGTAFPPLAPSLRVSAPGLRLNARRLITSTSAGARPF